MRACSRCRAVIVDDGEALEHFASCVGASENSANPIALHTCLTCGSTFRKRADLEQHLPRHDSGTTRLKIAVVPGGALRVVALKGRPSRIKVMVAKNERARR